jgi:ABC-type nitrate/sulfonate/bicarbonate transport system ATPase subunit
VVTHVIEEAALLGQKILLLGKPPNHMAQIIENPDFLQAGYRDSPAYRDVCRDLRARLEAL